MYDVLVSFHHLIVCASFRQVTVRNPLGNLAGASIGQRVPATDTDPATTGNTNSKLLKDLLLENDARGRTFLEVGRPLLGPQPI